MHDHLLNTASASSSINRAHDAGQVGERRHSRTVASWVTALAGVVALMALGAPAQAQPSVPHAMALGAATSPPPGYLNFCARLPQQCGLGGADAQGRPVSEAELRASLFRQYYWPAVFGGVSVASGAAAPASGAPEQPAAVDAPLTASPATLGELDKVNLNVNRAIRYVSDRVLYGQTDYWRLVIGPDGKGVGDCKDYVLEKRRALIADGVPAADLSIAIVQTQWGEAHAILLVSTDRGELVLDSLSQWVQPWWKVHYRWIKRQAPGQQLSWVSL